MCRLQNVCPTLMHHTELNYTVLHCAELKGTALHYELDGVGPVDKRPSTNWSKKRRKRGGSGERGSEGTARGSYSSAQLNKGNNTKLKVWLLTLLL